MLKELLMLNYFSISGISQYYYPHHVQSLSRGQPRGRKYDFGINTMVALKGLAAGVWHHLCSSQQNLLKKIWSSTFLQLPHKSIKD